MQQQETLVATCFPDPTVNRKELQSATAFRAVLNLPSISPTTFKYKQWQNSWISPPLALITRTLVWNSHILPKLPT